ncbi:MAG: guanylate kinase [Myxococcales bacterium]|nr:guanylate kinase [Myxococcales bacterium]
MSKPRTSPEVGADGVAEPQPGLLIVMTGPSGVGKSTVLRGLLGSDARLALSVSHTTRPPRPGEREGVDYYYVDDDTFGAMVAAEAFAEWAPVHARRYGTSKAEIARLRAAGRDIVLDIDVQGAEQLRSVYPDAVSIFILPPSITALEARLRGRKTEDEAQLAIRLARSEAEIACAGTYHYLIVNDDVAQAVADFAAIIRAERRRCHRQLPLMERLLRETEQRPKP